MYSIEPLQFNTLRQKVYEHLKKQINAGKILPGAFLDLNRLSADLEISRTPLRDALIRLEAEGFVTFFPRRGVILNPMSPEEIRNIYQIIGSLESSVILNCRNEMARTCVNNMKIHTQCMYSALEKDDFDEFYSHNLSLHNVFLDLSPNSELVFMVKRLKERLYDFPRKKTFIKEWEITSTGEHEKVIAMLEEERFKDAADYLRDVHWSFEAQEQYIRQYYFQCNTGSIASR
ncbi:MAG TPA: GntR family transcriptional regulator [Synergistales bacterium]|nr:GntR family transcriptional regulator [Synergistales bacterium]